jgi:hypothetical protein
MGVCVISGLLTHAKEPPLVSNLALVAPAHITLAELRLDAEEAILASRSRGTMRAYASDQRQFLAFCARHGLAALPAEPSTVTLWLLETAKTARIASVQRKAAAIAAYHADAGLLSPTAHPRS